MDHYILGPILLSLFNILGGNQKSQTELLTKEVHFTHEYLMKVPMNELDMPIMMSHFFRKLTNLAKAHSYIVIKLGYVAAIQKGVLGSFLKFLIKFR